MKNFKRDPLSGALINISVPNNVENQKLVNRVNHLEKELREIRVLLMEMRENYGDRKIRIV